MTSTAAMIAVDPLFSGHVSWSVLAVVLIKVVTAFVVLLVAVMLYIWFMRKVIADMQNRIGPNNAGPDTAEYHAVLGAWEVRSSDAS